MMENVIYKYIMNRIIIGLIESTQDRWNQMAGDGGGHTNI